MLADVIRAGERWYQKHEATFRKRYPGKVIALDVETGDVCGAGATLTDAALAVAAAHPGRQFYFKRVNSPYAAHVLRRP